MPRTNILLVLAVHEPGLRSSLAAQLSMVGADVITADDIHDPALERAMRGTAALIVDEALASRNPPGWIETLRVDPRWHHVVVLTPDPSESKGEDGRLLFLDRAGSATAIVELLPGWSAES